MTDFFAVLDSRRSVRAFEPREVEEELLRRILRGVRAAPSAGNLQAFRVVVVRDVGRRRELARASLDQQFVAQAPLVLAFFQDQHRSATKYGSRGKGLYSLQDATIACAYAQLVASALGLATCWVGAFNDQAIKRILAAPAGMTPVALLPVGYPAETPAPTGRLPLGELILEESFPP
jgi:nitroreductase